MATSTKSGKDFRFQGKCNDCGHQWMSHRNKISKKCPRCQRGDISLTAIPVG